MKNAKNQELQPLQSSGVFKISKDKLIEFVTLAQHRTFAEEIDALEEYTRNKKITNINNF